jgi:hypothetical protein
MLCPPGSEGLVYAVLTTIMNLSGTVASDIGSTLTLIWVGTYLTPSFLFLNRSNQTNISVLFHAKWPWRSFVVLLETGIWPYYRTSVIPRKSFPD